ncbi:MAG: hypothetical protein ACE5NA_08160 [Nitrospiraceae bacterium]
MRGFFISKQIVLGIGVVFLLGAMGCATASDLQKLDQGLTQKLDTANSSLMSEIKDLRGELKTVQSDNEKQQAELVRTLEQFRSDNKAAMEDMRRHEALRSELLLKEVRSETARTREALAASAKENEQALAQIVALNDGTHKRLEHIQKTVATVKQLPSFLTGLNTEMHMIRQTLLGGYKLEEAALKERLKILEKVRMQLEPVVAERPKGKFAAE